MSYYRYTSVVKIARSYTIACLLFYASSPVCIPAMHTSRFVMCNVVVVHEATRYNKIFIIIHRWSIIVLRRHSFRHQRCTVMSESESSKFIIYFFGIEYILYYFGTISRKYLTFKCLKIYKYHSFFRIQH